MVEQQDRLLNLRLLDEIGRETYAEKATKLRDEESKLRLEMEALTQERYEIAVKACELPQKLTGAVGYG